MSAIPQPGVTVVQEFQTTSPTVSSAALPASIIGPAYEVIDVLLTDGTVNSDASAGTYDQMPEEILQASFPNPRGNIDELNIDEESIRAFLLFGGQLSELPRGDGSPRGTSFLSNENPVRRAALQSVVNDAAGAWTADVVGGRSFILAFDVVDGDTTRDVTVTLPGVGAVSASDLVDAINTAVGSTVASVATVGGGDGVLITTTTYGASGSVTVRGSNAVATALFTAATELRVEGAGYRGQDDGDGDLTTPWIEFFVGASYQDSVAEAFGTTPAMGLVDNEGTFAAAAAPSLTFTTGSADIPLQAATSSRAGDVMFAGGAQVLNAEIIEVQSSRFRLGTLNSALSTFDEDGFATTRVYDAVEVATPSSSSAFAPRYAWFRAQGLQFGSVTPTPQAASLTGSNTGQAAQPAEVQSSFALANYPLTLTGLTLVISYIKDGVSQDQLTLTMTSDPANSAALKAEIDARLAAAGVAADFAVTVWDSATEAFVHIETTATGDDQSLTISATGTANSALGFSTVSDTSHTGKDIEFASQAAESSLQITLPLPNLAGKTLELTVVDSRGTHVQTCLAAGVTAAAADTTLADLATELNLQSNQLAWDGDIQIGTFSGPASASGELTFTTVEAGSAVSFTMTNTVTDGWRILGFFDANPFECVADGAGAYPLAGTEQLVLNVTDGQAGSPHTLTSAVLGALASAEATVQALNADAAATQNGGVDIVSYFVTSGGDIGIRSVEDTPDVTVLDLNLGLSTNEANLGWSGAGGETGAGVTGANDDESGTSDLQGTLLRWVLNDGQCDFEATFPSDSIEDAVETINLVHGGFAVASTSGGALILTSPLLGVASRVEVDSSSAAATPLGFTGLNDDTETAALPSLAGSGRPNPDCYVDTEGDVRLGADILRNTLTGQPFCPATATIYLDFNALRLDVSPLATGSAEKLLTIDDTTVLSTLLSPLDTRNPLGLGMFLALLNSPTVSVTGIGVDEVSAAQPEGTVDAYARAADVLEAKDVYALAPLSSEELVHQLFNTHVSAMSQPDQRGERIVFINPEMPDRAFPTTLASGEANSTATSNELVLDTNPTQGIVDAGLNPAALDADDGVYVEVTVNGDFRRYSVSLVNGTLAQFRVSFVAGENDDGFYSVTPLTETVIDGTYAIKVRGAELLIPGSSLPDNSGVASAMAALSGSYSNRRTYSVFPDSVDLDLASGTVTAPGYYACAAIAGMVGQENPSQPFTNMPITGLSGVTGSSDRFKPQLLDIIAGGGTYILHQSVPGAPVTCRHQLSTDVSSIEKRELSITKAVDYVAKYLRNALRAFIGNQNITAAFLDQLSTVTQAQLSFLGSEGLGVIAGARLNSLTQAESAPDTILIDITLDVLYPANYIQVTLVV